MYGTRTGPVRHRVDLHRPPAFDHEEKEKKSENHTFIRLFEIVSLLISQWTPNLQGSAPEYVRQTALYIRTGCGEEGR